MVFEILAFKQLKYPFRIGIKGHLPTVRGCLELPSRTARAIAGHLEQDLGECIRQIHNHLRRQCPELRSFGVFRLREVFFLKTKF